MDGGRKRKKKEGPHHANNENRHSRAASEDCRREKRLPEGAIEYLHQLLPLLLCSLLVKAAINARHSLQLIRAEETAPCERSVPNVSSNDEEGPVDSTASG